MRKLKDLTEKEKSEIISKRNNGIYEKIILSEYNISERQYSNLLKLFDIKKRQKIQKYNFNEDYFEKIDTEDKAYFLGFIVADGNISRDSNCIKIIQKETYILYEFKKFINYEGDIFTSKNRNISCISISSEKTKKDLYNLGIFSNKTMNILYPDISDNLQSHFMRGVFDGDGCISIHHDKRDNSDRGQVNICSGSIDFINTYVNKLVEYANVNKNNIRCPKGTYNVIDWGGLTDVENIYNFLYKDATIYLERKKEIFDKVMTIHSEKNKYRKK